MTTLIPKYDQGATGAVNRPFNQKLAESVSVKDFGAVGDGVTDDTAAITAARDYIASQIPAPTLVFPAGTYVYSVSPNWAISDASIIADGEVFLRYTGSGNAVIFDAGATIATIFNVKFLGNFIVQATASALNGFFVRSVHHSIFEGRVDGCGATSAAILVNFSVLSEFRVKTTFNETGAWYSGAQPLNGMVITQRDAGELTTACTFINPIIEGVSGAGIVLDYASNNTFIGGTSEGNAGLGMQLTANSVNNLIESIDLEVNTGGAISDAGAQNTYLKVNATDSVTLTGSNARFLTGSFASIIDNGVGTSFFNTTYGVDSGTLTGTQLQQTRFNLFNANGFFEQNKSYDSFITPSTSVPTATATTVITIDNTGISGNRFYTVIAYDTGLGAAYAAVATVYRDGNTLYIINQTNGANLSLTVTGLDIQVTQTSGTTLDVFAKAAVI